MQSFEDANHPPIVILDGDDSKEVLHRRAKAGSRIALTAADSKDPDGDRLHYRWFHYPEAGRDLENLGDLWSIPIEGDRSPSCEFLVPVKRPRRGDDIHIILEVKDDGEPNLRAYRRVIVSVQE